MRIVSRWTSSWPRGLALHGTLIGVLLASAPAALKAQETGLDLRPRWAAKWPGYVRLDTVGVAASDTMAYVAAGSLQVIDLSHPGAPTRIGWYDSNQAVDVEVSGSYLSSWKARVSRHRCGGLW